MKYANQMTLRHAQHPFRTERMTFHLSGWALSGGILATIFVVQAALAARLFVQIFAIQGRLADLAYDSGGLFQAPFAGYSAGAIKTRGIFEPETILAMSGYAVLALGAILLIAAMSLPWHRFVSGAFVEVAGELARWMLKVPTASLREGRVWMGTVLRRAEPQEATAIRKRISHYPKGDHAA
jgi:hypothetical protein